eukprot:279117_1
MSNPSLKVHNDNFSSLKEEEDFLDNMIAENSFVFSSEGRGRDIDSNDDNEYIYDDNKQNTHHADNNESNIESTDDEHIHMHQYRYDPRHMDLSSSDTDLDAYDHEPNTNYNKNKKQRLKNKYKYRYIGNRYRPNPIEQLTTAKWGHQAALDRFISPWTLTYIGDHNVLDTPERYPRWINYKYSSYNTAHMITLSFIIMILASIHISFTTDITLLVFTMALVGIMIFIYLAKVILNTKNWKAILIFSATIGSVLVVVWMVVASGPLALSEREVMITMVIGIASVFCFCLVIYLMTHNVNNLDSYTVCTGFGALYIIVQHTLAANLSTDKFLIYFCLLLFLATFAGYIPFKHYCICVLLLWIEYNVSGFAQFYQYVVIGSSVTSVTAYEIIFANIVLWILFIVLGFMVYHREKVNRYEYLDFQVITRENRKRIQKHDRSKDVREVLNNGSRLAMIEEKEDESSIISSLSNVQKERRLSDPVDMHLNKAISALPQPIYRLQSNLGQSNEIIDHQTSIVYSPHQTNDYSVGMFPNRAQTYQMLYQIANKIVGRKQSNTHQHQHRHIIWDKIVQKGVIRASPFSKLGEFFGHQSNSSRPQYITREQQALLHAAAQNAPELNGLSYAEKENVIQSNENEMNNRHKVRQLWSIAHLPSWYMMSSKCILHGYRNNINSFATVLFSLICWIHNEQFVILIDYTLCCAQALWIAYMCYKEDTFYNLQSVHTQLIVLLCVSIAISRGFVSGTAHLFHCMNEEISRKAWNIDFIWMLMCQCALSIVWIHFIFFCDLNQQILFSFFCIILSLIAIITAYYSIQPLLKDVSIFYAIAYNHVFLFGYVMITVGMKDNDMPWRIVVYWFVGFVLLIIGCLFKYFEFPEECFLRRHLRQFIGDTVMDMKAMKVRKEHAEIDKTLAEIDLIRLSGNDKSDYTIYYFGNSHQLYHLFVHGLLCMNIFAFREYLNWRVDHLC